MSKGLFAAFVAALIWSLTSCHSQANEHIAETTTGGSARRGAAAIARYGCGSCHLIPGIPEAVGHVGPPLSGIANRTYLAGVVQNTPSNMMRWLEDPKAIDEKTIMPNLGVTPADAADIGGYLYTLR